MNERLPSLILSETGTFRQVFVIELARGTDLVRGPLQVSSRAGASGPSCWYDKCKIIILLLPVLLTCIYIIEKIVMSELIREG